MIWVNGQVQTQIAVSDRALHYGDGCFTTLPFRQGELWAWPLHLARLQDNCLRLGIDFTFWSELSQSLQQVMGLIRPQQSEGVIKIIITRGSGGRGYSPFGVQHPSYIISTHDFPVHYRAWQKNGIKLTVSPVKLGKQPLLAGIKHLNRLEQVFIKQKLEQTSFDDALVCASDDQIIESSAGNIFWLQQGQWFTPYLDECGVEGVMRNFICDLLQKKSAPVQPIRQGLNADFVPQEMFVCNSLMEIVPVTSLYRPDTAQQQRFTCERVKALQALLKQALKNE